MLLLGLQVRLCTSLTCACIGFVRQSRVFIHLALYMHQIGPRDSIMHSFSMMSLRESEKPTLFACRPAVAELLTYLESGASFL